MSVVFRCCLSALSFCLWPAAVLQAEIIFAADFSTYQDGPLASQHGWTESDGEPGAASILGGKLVLTGDGGARALSPPFRGDRTLYYGFDITVQTAPAGRRRVVAGLCSDQWTRAHFIVSASPRKTDGTYAVYVIDRPPEEEVAFEFDTTMTYRVVVFADASQSKLWFAAAPDKDAPHQEVSKPNPGPFTGLYFQPQPGELEIANVVVATSFEEAADPAAASRLTPTPASAAPAAFAEAPEASRTP